MQVTILRKTVYACPDSMFRLPMIFWRSAVCANKPLNEKIRTETDKNPWMSQEKRKEWNRQHESVKTVSYLEMLRKRMWTGSLLLKIYNILELYIIHAFLALIEKTFWGNYGSGRVKLALRLRFSINRAVFIIHSVFVYFQRYHINYQI